MELRKIFVKATGIVRRIDDLGRVVVPKEIRKTLRIRKAIRLKFYRQRRKDYFKKVFPGGRTGGRMQLF